MSCCCRASQEPQELRIVIVKIADNEEVLKTFMKSSEEYKTIPPSETFTKQNLNIEQQKVVVIETPFLCHAEKTDEELKKELKECVSQSDPGPHVFLLVFGNQKFTQQKQNAVDLFKNSFGKDVLRYTMAVFPFGKDLEEGGQTIEDYINKSPQLKSCVDECEGGCHVIKDGVKDPTQGTKLLQKIIALVQKNKGRYYDIKQSEKDEKLRKRILHVLKLKIVIVKIADNEEVLKTFMKSSEENKTIPPSETFTKQNLNIEQQKVVVIETPFLCHAEKTDEELKKELKECVSQSDPGPHVFLLVFGHQKFTQQKQNAVDLFKNSFGKDVLRYTMAVFPFGKDLEKDGKTIEDYINKSPQLKSCVDECEGGCHVIKDGVNDPTQGTKLLQKINELVQKNKGRYYDIKQSEKDEKLRKRILHVLMVTAVVGACIGGSVASYLNGNTVGLFAVLGALGGCLLGAVGIVAVERIKNLYLKCCGKCRGQRAVQDLATGEVTGERTALMCLV